MSRTEIAIAIGLVLALAGWTGNEIYKSVDHNRDKIASNRDKIAEVEQKAAVTEARVEWFHPTPQQGD